eukprot:9149682-Alexandrium_andersonii.AAC.1
MGEVVQVPESSGGCGSQAVKADQSGSQTESPLDAKRATEPARLCSWRNQSADSKPIMISKEEEQPVQETVDTAKSAS